MSVMSNWDEVHEIAEQMEHIKSPLLVERLDEFLGRPKVDPHGDPIPDQNGEFEVGEVFILSEFRKNDRVVIIGVGSSEPTLLQYLEQKKIRPGVKVKVLEKIEFDGSMNLEIEGSETLFISDQVSCQLNVRKIV